MFIIVGTFELLNSTGVHQSENTVGVQIKQKQSNNIRILYEFIRFSIYLVVDWG